MSPARHAWGVSRAPVDRANAPLGTTSWLSGGWNGHQWGVADDTHDPEERDEPEAAVLPAREAMSLITPDAAPSFLPDLGPAGAGAPDPAQAAQGAAVDAQGSASGEESVSSDDRSEQISNQDTASSQT